MTTMTQDLVLPPVTDEQLYADRMRSERTLEAYQHSMQSEGRRCPEHRMKLDDDDDGWVDTCPWHTFCTVSCVCGHCLYVDFTAARNIRFLDSRDPMGYDQRDSNYDWYHGGTTQHG